MSESSLTLKDQSIVLLSNEQFGYRMTNPKYFSRLNIFLTENNILILLKEKKDKIDKPKIEPRHFKNYPRIVVYPSNTYLFLMEIMMHLCMSNESINIAERNLHRFRFKSIDWERITRKEIFALNLLARGWYAISKTTECSTCHTVFDTERLLLNPCVHLPKFVMKDNPITKGMLDHCFSNIDFVNRIGLFLYRVAKALNDE